MKLGDRVRLAKNLRETFFKKLDMGFDADAVGTITEAAGDRFEASFPLRTPRQEERKALGDLTLVVKACTEQKVAGMLRDFEIVETDGDA